MNTPTKMQHETYPVRFSVDYPDRELNRVATAFRAFAAIPILTVLAAISGGSGSGRETTVRPRSRSAQEACCASVLY